ncbi:MAG: TonB-dependent receptor [Acidobacteria bacterium]|nr:TonB-dependent receptor [Acidobacteriota bacterium]
MNTWRKLIPIFGILLLGAWICEAQSDTAQIVGRVTDASSAVVPSAQLSVTNEETGIKRETISNESGNFVVPLLPPGTYRIKVEKTGFRPLIRSGVVLQVDQVARIDFVMELGAVSESINVVAEVPLLSSETSSLGQVIDHQKIADIPLNGRSPFRLVQLTPGILSVPSTNGQFNDIPVNTVNDSMISINGGRRFSNEIMIDGIPSTTGYENLVTTIPSVDATQEFKVQSSNLSAEWGRLGGGVINVSTKSGTNALHGSLFEFLRNSAADANEFFNKSAGKDKPPFRMNQYGFSAGGPIMLGRLYDGRNRTFFFADYQGSRWRQGDVFITTVPTQLEKSGNFTQTLNTAGAMIQVYDPVTTRPDPNRPGQYVRDAFPGNIIPVSRMDPVARKVVTFYPEPNTAGNPFTHQNNFVSNASRGIDQANYSVRGDHNISERHRIFGRVAALRTTLAQPDYFANPATSGPGANGNLRLHNYTAALDNTVTFSPSMVMSVRYGFARFFWGRPTRSFGFDQTTLGFPASLVSQFSFPVFPAITVEGYAAAGGSGIIFTGQDTHSLISSLNKVTGRHNIKVGADVRLRRMNTNSVSAAGGSYSFTRVMTRGPDPNVLTANAGVGLASLLLGTGASGSVNTASGSSLQNWYYAGYVQDDIRLSNTFTLNVGLRYETESPYTERRNQLAWFDFNQPSPLSNSQFPNLTGGLHFAGTSGDDRYVFDWEKKHFAPRAGFAYTVRPKTVIRGGAGLFYAPLENALGGEGFSPNPGFSATTTYVGTQDTLTPYYYLSNPYPSGLNRPVGSSMGAATYAGQSIQVWDSHPSTPYVWQWNLDVQQQLPGSMLIDLAYSGSRGVKLAQQRQFDAIPPSALPQGTGLQQLVNNPFASSIATGPLSQARVALRQLVLPYPQFTGINVVNSTSANSIYHSMALKLEKRFGAGVSVLLSYTVSKLISDAGNGVGNLGTATDAGLDSTFQNPYNLRAERSISEIDTPQSLTVSYVVALPFGPHKALLGSASGLAGKLLEGWQLGGVTSFRRGFPLMLSAPVVGVGNRPNSTGRSAQLPSSRSRSEEIRKWFDTSAFTLPSPFTYGNVSRTLPDVRGPSLTNIDLSLFKDNTIRERVKLQVRAEAFNLLNTPHFWLPNTTFGNLQFGQISSTTGFPRVLQFALKLTF